MTNRLDLSTGRFIALGAIGSLQKSQLTSTEITADLILHSLL